MDHRCRILSRLALLLLLGAPPVATAQIPAPIDLPAPQLDRGRPLMQVLQDRQTSREFDLRPLPLQEVSNLLWAAWGINRPESGKRTAPSAVNWQEIELYVALPQGLFRYEAEPHRLAPVHGDDIRAATGTQTFVAQAPLTIVLVADKAKITRASETEKEWYSAIDAGFISQNIYLYCASEGLATGVRALVDRERLAVLMRLRPEERIVVAQTVGYPGS
jgi:SagB-type dehydrogenase family enzyme